MSGEVDIGWVHAAVFPRWNFQRWNCAEKMNLSRGFVGTILTRISPISIGVIRVSAVRRGIHMDLASKMWHVTSDFFPCCEFQIRGRKICSVVHYVNYTAVFPFKWMESRKQTWNPRTIPHQNLSCEPTLIGKCNVSPVLIVMQVNKLLNNSSYPVWCSRRNFLVEEQSWLLRRWLTFWRTILNIENVFGLFSENRWEIISKHFTLSHKSRALLRQPIDIVIFQCVQHMTWQLDA